MASTCRALEKICTSNSALKLATGILLSIQHACSNSRAQHVLNHPTTPRLVDRSRPIPKRTEHNLGSTAAPQQASGYALNPLIASVS